MTNLPSLTKAEENCIVCSELSKRICTDFLELGGLLLENYENAYWNVTCESFKDFVEMLGIEYSRASRLMTMAKVVTQQLLTPEEIVEIGYSKTCLLLPKARKGELDEDTKLLARDCTFTDLRRELGHNIESESEEYINCPRCGEEFAVYRGMIHKR